MAEGRRCEGPIYLRPDGWYEAPGIYGPAPPVCRCGEANCMYLELGYPFCAGCGDHHRRPCATQAGDRCPVDLFGEQFEKADAAGLGALPALPDEVTARWDR